VYKWVLFVAGIAATVDVTFSKLVTSLLWAVRRGSNYWALDPSAFLALLARRIMYIKIECG
jgi:hypothetical protein